MQSNEINPTGIETLLSGRGVTFKNQKLFFALLALTWTVAIGLFLFWSLDQLDQRVIESARIQARSAVEKDVLYRRWSSLYGGVYGKISDWAPPNKYLKDKERDIETPLGIKLTKINPAYMTRQVHELGESKTGVLGHITSLDPIRPENRADEWEAASLSKMERNPVEVSSVQELRGVSYLRLMIPLITEESCLYCHEEQGYKIGEIRGGISVSVPLAPLTVNIWKDRLSLISAFLLAWLLGGVAIWGVARIKIAEVYLRFNEEKYRVLVETMNEGLVILDNRGHIVFSSKPLSEMLGWSISDLLDVEFQVLLPDDSKIRILRIFDDEIFDKSESFEIAMQRRDGTIFNILFSPKPLMGRNGEFLGILAVVTDITLLKEMEEELARSQRFSSFVKLAGGVVHEINTPVYYIRTNMTFLNEVFEEMMEAIALQEPLLSRLKNDNNYAGEIEAIESRLKYITKPGLKEDIVNAFNENMEGLQRIADIVVSIQSLVGTSTSSSEIADINILVQEAVDATRGSWKPVADLKMDLAPMLPEIKCMTGNIVKVLVSIIMNAVHAIAEKQVELNNSDKREIKISTREIEGNLQIVIIDAGSGLSEEVMENVFEPFYTTKSQGEGVGQGMAIAYRIVLDHGGTITADNVPGGGAEFTVTLPID